MTPAFASVLAHQGGWDEIMFVLAPLAIFAGLLLMARKRVAHLDDEEPTEAPGPEGDPSNTSR